MPGHTTEPHFKKQSVIFIPAYNCGETIVSVIRDIPPDVRARADILVIDNCSEDDTAGRVLEARRSGELGDGIVLIQPSHNLGYAGSQKLAYRLVCRSQEVRWVAMLHGDGQYPSELLQKFVALSGRPEGVIYGYRSKLWYPFKEETPFTTWFIIRLLSIVESFVTGVWRAEWHSGFVMYATRFLRKVNLHAVTNTPHIDGHLLFAASVLRESVLGIPIYKRYRSLNPFEGAARRRYVMHVLRLMWSMRMHADRLVELHADESLAPGAEENFRVL